MVQAQLRFGIKAHTGDRQETEENSVRASGRKAQGEIHDIAVRERGEELVIVQGKSGMT
jgi:hypothetical protein